MRTTPGPWTAKPSEDGDTIWIGNDGEHACCVPGYTDHPGNKANAALVAAAPTMLAALQELQRLGEEGMKPDYGEWLTFHDKVAQVARKAIARTVITFTPEASK
jgi:hypothetical protein